MHLIFRYLQIFYFNLQVHHISQCHIAFMRINNTVGKITANQQGRKQFMLLAEFVYLLITFIKLLIRTQLSPEAVYLSA